MMNILSATVANVAFPVESGFIEGLMDEDGSFYVGVPQICSLFSIPTKHASRDIKALLGKEKSVTIKLKTPLHSNPVSAIPITHIQRVRESPHPQQTDFRSL